MAMMLKVNVVRELTLKKLFEFLGGRFNGGIGVLLVAEAFAVMIKFLFCD